MFYKSSYFKVFLIYKTYFKKKKKIHLIALFSILHLTVHYFSIIGIKKDHLPNCASHDCSLCMRDHIRTLHAENWLSLTEVDKSEFCPNTSDSKLRLRKNKNWTFDFLKMLDMTPSAIFWKYCFNAQYLYVNECFNLWAVKRSRRILSIV